MIQGFRVVYAIFAGRRKKMEIQLRYVDALCERGLVDEVHVWDMCANDVDRAWVQSLPYRIMTGARKGDWQPFYRHYATREDPSTVLIKADDDIVCIDIDHFQQFIEFVICHPEFYIVLPNIVNNGVCAYLQQQRGLFNLALDLPAHNFGKLWSSPSLWLDLHAVFLDHPDEFAYDGHTIIDAVNRASINFFAMLQSAYVRIFPHIGEYDEIDLNKKWLEKDKVVVHSMYVCHFSFCKQEEEEETEIRARSATVLQGYDALSREKCVNVLCNSDSCG